MRELAVGDGFGTISAVFRRPNPETVKARTDAELYVLQGSDLVQVMAADPGLDERVQVILMARQ